MDHWRKIEDAKNYKCETKKDYGYRTYDDNLFGPVRMPENRIPKPKTEGIDKKLKDQMNEL